MSVPLEETKSVLREDPVLEPIIGSGQKQARLLRGFGGAAPNVVVRGRGFRGRSPLTLPEYEGPHCLRVRAEARPRTDYDDVGGSRPQTPALVGGFAP